MRSVALLLLGFLATAAAQACEEKEECDTGLVCLMSTCTDCTADAQCESRERCDESRTVDGEMHCQYKAIDDDFDYIDVLLFLVAFVGGALAAGGGVGGGGVFIPTFVLLGGFSVRDAVPLSNMTILGVAIVNTPLLGRVRHPNANRPLINYDAAFLIGPMMLLGTVIGVIANTVSPSYLVTALLFIVLTITSVRTLKKGRSLWAAERAAAAAEKDGDASSLDDGHNSAFESISFMDDGGSDSSSSGSSASEDDASSSSSDASSSSSDASSSEDASSPSSEDAAESSSASSSSISAEVAAFLAKDARTPWGKLGLLFLMVMFIAFISLARGGRTGKSELGIRACSAGYWLLFAAIFPVFITVVAIVARSLYVEYTKRVACGFPFLEGDLQLTKKRTILLPIFSTVAGIAASFLGIGGGMVLGPLMLELGMSPDVVSATSALLILLSAVASVVQFVILGRIIVDYGLVLLAIGATASFVGVKLIRFIVTKYRKRSVIVFLLSVVIMASNVLLLVSGILALVDQIDKDSSDLDFRGVCDA